MRSVLLLAACAYLSACAHPRIVVTEGSAPWRPADPGASRAEAVADAQRRAATEAGESRIAARVTVDGAVLTRSQTTAVSKARLAESTVIEESLEDGRLRVTVRSRVAASGGRGVDILPPLRVQMDGPPCADASFRRALLARGVPLSPSAEAAVSAAVSLGRSEPGLAGFLSRRASVRAQIKGADGAVLAAAVEDAGGLGADGEQAGCEAAGRAAEAAAGDLAAQLARL